MSQVTNGSGETDTPDATAVANAVEGPEGDDSALRLRGRAFLLALYKALRSIKLYPMDNVQVRESLDELASTTSDIVTVDGGLEVRISSEILYVNAVRLRMDVDNFASFGHVIRAFSRAGVGMLLVDTPPGQQEWKTFVSHLLTFEPEEDNGQRLHEFQRLILERGVRNVIVGPRSEGDADLEDESARKLAAKRTYQQSVSVTKELFESARMGRTPRLRHITRVVQSIVDQVLNNEVTMMGLSRLRGYDDYTYTSTVNVCIFSLAIGRRLGLSKSRLFDLGIAALLHDVGKSRVDVDLLVKPGDLTDAELSRMKAHTWLGALCAFELRQFGEIPLRGMITAYEHHMKVDLSGYPKARRPRELSVYSKIVAVADAYNSATTARDHAEAKSPDVVLRELWEDPSYGHDPVLVKALINLLGIYPVGTCVILDTFEVGLVHAANSDSTHIDRPIVRILGDGTGQWLDDPPLVDLAVTESDGSFSRSIIKVTDPDRYLINVSDYFV